MKYILLFVICIGIHLHGQDADLAPKFSYQIESDLANGKINASRASTLYSNIGDYHMANALSDIPISWGIDTMDLSMTRVSPALPYIVNRAKDHKIVIISENHHKPQHRIFAKQIIKELANIGYTNLAMEALNNRENSIYPIDSLLQERGYPLDGYKTGIYTMEPRMGEFIRMALRCNYDLFSYEKSQNVEGKDRDEIQAENIVKILKKNPESKLIIFCGFHHAVESDLIKRRDKFWMAKYIKDYTGMDPLTIYQDNFTEKIKEDEHPILQNLQISSPSVFIDDQGEILKLSDHVDIEIIHPKTTYKNGRPSWLFENENYKSLRIDILVDQEQFPIFVSASKLGEVHSVPSDRIELKHRYDNKHLVLEKGAYEITLFDGNTESKYLKIVE